MRQIESKELKRIRKIFHKKQKRICPIIKLKFSNSEMVVDHSHKSNAKNLGNDDGRLIRGVIHRQANVMEGKITNSFIRCGLHKMNITLPEFLRNLADYYENPPLTHKKLRHPSEKPAKPKLMKRSYQKLITRLNKVGYTKKIPEFRVHKTKPSRNVQTMTRPLEKLYGYVLLEPEFYT